MSSDNGNGGRDLKIMEKLGMGLCVWVAQMGAARWYGAEGGSFQIPGVGSLSYPNASGVAMALGSVAGQFMEDFIGDSLDVESQGLNFAISTALGAGISTVTSMAVAPGVVEGGGGPMNYAGQAAIANFAGAGLYGPFKTLFM